jgi:hypothetical protein
MATLVYLGGASLTFGSGSGRRVVKRGEPFEVSAELAKVLLADPYVSTPEEVGTMFTAEAVASPVARPHSTSGLDAIKALRARAKELGIPAEADTTPAPGAITLGDLPPSAKVGGS